MASDRTFRLVDVHRVDSDGHARQHVRAAVEERLELRVDGRTVATATRTPDEDDALILGLLFAKGLIRSASQVRALRRIAEDTGSAPGTVVDVTLHGDAEGGVPTSTGHASASWIVASAVVLALPDRLRTVQAGGAEPGGLHAAALFMPDGEIDGTPAEDVGRRAVVDKLIGRALQRGAWTLADRLLFSTGRTSPEVVERAAIAGIPIVASTASASTMAIDEARRRRITLIGSVRGTSFNIYSHPERVAL